MFVTVRCVRAHRDMLTAPTTNLWDQLVGTLDWFSFRLRSSPTRTRSGVDKLSICRGERFSRTESPCNGHM